MRLGSGCLPESLGGDWSSEGRYSGYAPRINQLQASEISSRFCKGSIKLSSCGEGDESPLENSQCKTEFEIDESFRTMRIMEIEPN